MKKISFCCIFLFSSFFLMGQPVQDFEMEILLPCTPVKDQAYSGTCWSFATCSFLESEIMRINKNAVANLSEMFVARQAYLLKLETYLKSRGAIFFTAGGQPHDVLRVIKENGIVPSDYYSGNVFYKEHYHPPLDSLMLSYAKNLLSNGKTTLNDADKAFAENILDVFLGKLPKEYRFQNQNYTAKRFSTEVLSIKPDDYIEVTSIGDKPFYEKIVLEDKYNWLGETYYNVPLEDLVFITNEALRKGYSLVWNGDSVEPTFQAEKGLVYLPAGVAVSQESRQAEIDKKNTQIEHVMHIVGLAREKPNEKFRSSKKNKKTEKYSTTAWYYIKNSWGEISPFKGFLYMSEDYFKMKTISILLHKEALPKAIKLKLKL